MSDTAPKPNILYILADDMGYGDVGFHGSRIHTPNLDRIARTGVELTRHYVCPVCTPTRTCLMTGRHPGRFGVHATTPSNDPVLPDGYHTIASMLRDGGYETALFGKWHLGSDPQFYANKYGFDYSYGSFAGGIDPYNHCYKRGPWCRTWHRNGELVDERGHVTDLLTDEACQWIDQRSQDKPWFCYVPFTAIHLPIKAPEHWIDRYENTRYEDDPERDEAFKRYAAYTSHMDYSIGRLIETLKTTEQYDNTLVIFSSDNGAMPAIGMNEVGLYPGWQQDSLLMGNNAPFRGRKAQMYEGGICTPTIMRWPGTLPQGGRIDQPMHMVDWMPTLASMTGCNPKGDPQWDGIDMWPVLSGQTSRQADRVMYWNMQHTYFAVRHGEWKLIQKTAGDGSTSTELYNVVADIAETCDMAEREPAIVQHLQKVLADQHALDDTSVRPDIAAKN